MFSPKIWGGFSVLRQQKFRLSTAGKKRWNFGEVSAEDLRFFEGILGESSVKTNRDVGIEEYNTDFMKWYKGNSACVLLPQTAEQVSAILRHCFHRNLAVVPQSGNTGLVGGSVPVFDEIVLSLKKLAKNFQLDTSLGILQCDSGFILEALDARLATVGYMMPLDLGAKGSCLVGGTVATNAGGIRLLRYGSLHGNVLGMEVVIPDENGTVLNLGSTHRKDNSDVHLHKLFIGSEGLFGVITKVNVLVVPRPTSVQSAFLGVGSFEKCREILRCAKQMLNEILSSFELIDGEAMRCLKENFRLENVLSTNSDFNLLIETSGSNVDHDQDKMERFLSHCLESGLAEDGVLAKSVADANYLWKLREDTPLALVPDGYVYKHDLSLPMDHFYELTDVLRKRLGDKVIRVIAFGHVGDGNIHLNVTTPSFSQEVYDLLYPFIYEWVVERGGSISAEHGIGQYKLSYHNKLNHPKKLALNKEIKKVFDPRGILSPYKMIDIHQPE